ncbi:MAG: hypothetical protein J5983_01255 [Ruminococcus sp.]|nr:hypothetical protein [Ruminococcus sp.]
MKIKLSHIFRIILGAYLVYIGVMLFIDVYAQQPTNYMVLLGCAIFFIVIGMGYSTQLIRKWFKNTKLEKDRVLAAKKAAEEEKRHRELHSKDKFRTAPMPKVDTVKKRKEPVFASIADDPDVKIVYFDDEEEVKQNKKADKPAEVRENQTVSENKTPDEKKKALEVPEKTEEKKESSKNQDDEKIRLAINIAEEDTKENKEVPAEEEKSLAINIEVKEEEN